MRLKTTTAALILILAIGGWLFSRGAPQEETHPTIRQEDLLRQLSIEPIKESLAPDFLLRDLGGNSVRLHDLRGKVVLLNFWATWCPPCRLEMPSMEAVHKELGREGLAILAVNVREDAREVQAFFREYNLSFPAIMDEKGELFERFDVWSLPTTFLITKKGHLIGKLTGYRDWHGEETLRVLRGLLEEHV